MSHRRTIVATFAIFLLPLLSRGQQSLPSLADGGRQLPLLSSAENGNRIGGGPLFVENRGQWNAAARYLCQVPGLDLWITDGGMTFDYYEIIKGESTQGDLQNMADNSFDLLQNGRRRGTVVRMSVANGLTSARTVAEELETTSFTWISATGKEVTSRGGRRARIENIRPGVDALIYIERGNPRYDLVLKPGANPSDLQLQFEGTTNIRVTDDGALSITTSLGERRQEGLFAYQLIDGNKQQVACSFRSLGSGKVGFRVGQYDKSRPLVIDPIITGSYSGGSGTETKSPEADFGISGWLSAGREVKNGMALMVGASPSTNFPVTTGAYDQTLNGTLDGVIAILEEGTGTVLRATFIGGSDADAVAGADVASDGSIWIIGSTRSTNFPVTPTAFQNSYGSADTRGRGFIARLNSTLTSLTYASYINGGAGFRTIGQSIRTDGSDVWFAGSTTGASLPTTANAFAPEARFDNSEIPGFTSENLYFGRLNNNQLSLSYLSYINVPAEDISAKAEGSEKGGRKILAGDGIDNSSGAIGAAAAFPVIDVNNDGDVAVTAQHFSGDMPLTANAWQPTRFTATSTRGGWLGIFSSNGTFLEYGTYFGSPTANSNAAPFSILLEESGVVSVGGFVSSASSWETTEGALNRTLSGSADAFLFEIDADEELTFSTLIGGSGSDVIISNHLKDPCGRFVVGLRTSSTDFPVTPNGLKLSVEGTDGAIVLLSPDGDSLLYGTYLGGSGTDLQPTFTNVGNGLISGYMQTNTPGMLVTSDEDGQISLAGGSDFYYFELFPDEIYITIPETLRVDCANRDLPVFWSGGRGLIDCSPGYEVILGALSNNGEFTPFDTVSSTDGEWSGDVPPSLEPGTYRVVMYHRELGFAFDTSSTFEVETTGGGGITNFTITGHGGGQILLCPDEDISAGWSFDPASRPCLEGKLIRFELHDTLGGTVADLGTALFTDRTFSGTIPQGVDVGAYRLVAFDAESNLLLGSSGVVLLSQGELASDNGGKPLRSIAFGRVPARDFRDTTLFLVNTSSTCPLIIDAGTLRFESGDISPSPEFRLMEVLPNTQRDPVTKDWILPPGGRDSVRVRFQPVRGGSRRATIRIATDRRSTQIPGVTARGEFYWDFFGTGAVGIEVVGTNNLPGLLRFDPVIIGGEADEETLVLENTSVDPLSITAIAFDNPAFAIALASTNILPLIVEPGKRAEIILSHTAAAGSQPGVSRGKATLTISSGEKLIAELEGIVGKRELSATPTQITLKGEAGGVVRSFAILSNTGTLPVAISSISLQNNSPELQVRTPDRSVIEPGSFEFVELTWFSGSSSVSDALVVESNRVGGTLVIPINGIVSGAERDQVDPFGISARGVAGEEASDLQIWPNPARQMVSITGDLAGLSEGKIYDAAGRVIYRFDLKSVGTSFDVGKIPPGFYMVHLSGESGSRTLPITILR